MQRTSTAAGGSGKYDVYFENPGNQVLDGKTLTEEQKKGLWDAIARDDMYAALEILGIDDIKDLSEDAQKQLGTMWKDGTKDLLTDFCENFGSNLRDDIITNTLEASSKVSTSLASFINTATALAKGPAGNTSFVILNPNMVSTTGSLAKYGSVLGKTATCLSVGLPIWGGVIDYVEMRKDGECVVDAGIKSVAHVGIGLAGGAVGAKFGGFIGSFIPIPVVGTVVGAAVGFLAGVAITTLGNAVYDTLYDNREEIAEFAGEVTQRATEAVNHGLNKLGEKLGTFASGIGKAWSGGWDMLGTICG